MSATLKAENPPHTRILAISDPNSGFEGLFDIILNLVRFVGECVNIGYCSGLQMGSHAKRAIHFAKINIQSSTSPTCMDTAAEGANCTAGPPSPVRAGISQRNVHDTSTTNRLCIDRGMFI